MTLRTTSRGAIWFLNQFGSIPENESAIGDLIEKSQRGRGAIWHWRQVLAIVFGGVYQEFRTCKRQSIGGLIRTWCVWAGLQFLTGVLVMIRYRSLHPFGSDHGYTGNLIPLVTFRILTENHTRVWAISVLMVVLNILTLLLVGRYISSSSQVRPQSLLLTCITAFVIVDIGFIAANLLLIYLGQERDIGFLITDLIALVVVPTLLTIGGIGGMRKIPLLKGEGGPRKRAG